jgi:hypothetical protein
MTKLELFEPAMCCSTGVCGPSVDETLLTITSVFEGLSQVSSVEASRHNLTSDPDAFVSNQKVLTLMKESGKDSLPITLVNGEVVKSGTYPSIEELTNYTGVVFVEESESSSSCCGGSGCC